jgi:hypothetical protein
MQKGNTARRAIGIEKKISAEDTPMIKLNPKPQRIDCAVLNVAAKISGHISSVVSKICKGEGSRYDATHFCATINCQIDNSPARKIHAGSLSAIHSLIVVIIASTGQR